jgi:hypothetical protein
LSLRQIELHMNRDAWHMPLTTKTTTGEGEEDDDPLLAYERNERDILHLSSSLSSSYYANTTNATMLKCLFLRHLNALEHREYGIALDTLHQYFDHALWHGPFPSHKGTLELLLELLLGWLLGWLLGLLLGLLLDLLDWLDLFDLYIPPPHLFDNRWTHHSF